MNETPAVQPPGRESVFERVADYVSAAMGRPANIMVWFVLVFGWTALFAFRVVPASGSFLPSWFTSLGYNFPLNLVTTVAELFIGFLVAAAANRSERNLDRTLAGIGTQEQRIGDAEDTLAAALAANTELTQQVHALTSEVHRLVVQQASAPGTAQLAAAVEANTVKVGLVHQIITAAVSPDPAGSAGTARQAARRT